MKARITVTEWPHQEVGTYVDLYGQFARAEPIRKPKCQSPLPVSCKIGSVKVADYRLEYPSECHITDRCFCKDHKSSVLTYDRYFAPACSVGVKPGKPLPAGPCCTRC